MAKIIEVPHKGVTVKIRELTTLKNKTRYTEYQIVDYSSGKRVRHSRATLEEAKTKAKGWRGFHLRQRESRFLELPQRGRTVVC